MTTLLAGFEMFCVTGLLAGLMWNIHTTLPPLMVSEWNITGGVGG